MTHPQLIARTEEMQRVFRFLDRLRSGPSCLVIEGEQGIGKSSLLAAAVDAARSRRYQVLFSNPAESEAEMVFAGLGDLLGRVMDQVRAELPPPQVKALRIALFEETPDEPATAPPRRAVSLAFLGALRTLSASTPVVIVIDDLHWLDSPTALVLEFAIRRLEDEPVGVMTAVRREGLDPSHEELLRALFDKSPSEPMHLGPLEVRDLDQLLRDRSQATLSARTLGQLHAASGGNPLYAMEIARAVQLPEAGPAGQDLLIPKSLRDLVRERFAVLPTAAIDVLLTVASLSRPTLTAIRKAIGDPERTDAGMAAAVAGGIITVEDDSVLDLVGNHSLTLGHERIRFTHPLLGSALYADTPEGRRRELHRKLATIVAEPEEQARHLALGTEAADEAVAAKLEQAAIRARGRGSPEAGAGFLEHALRLTPPDSEEASRRRTILAAQHHFEAGEIRRARTLLESAVEASPPGPRRADALRRLGWLRYHEDSYDAASLLLRGALREAGDDASLRVAIERDLAWAALRFGHVSSAAHHAREALKQAESLDDVVGLAEALTAVGMAEMVLGRGIRADILQRAMQLEQQGEQLRITQHPSRTFGLLLKSADDLDRAKSRYEELLDRAHRQGDAASLPLLLQHLADIEWRTGDWSRAESLAEEGLVVAERTGQEPVRAGLLYTKSLVHAHQGRIELAREEADAGRLLAEGVGAPALVLANQAVLGFINLSLGSHLEAERDLGRLAELASAMRIGDPEVMRFLPDQVEVLVALGNLADARKVVPRLERGGRVLGRLWTRAAAGRCRGLILAAEGDTRTAIDVLTRSVAAHEQLGQPFALGRALMTLGVVLRRNKQKKAARTSLQRAFDTFEQLGAPLWSRLSQAELGRIGGRALGAFELTPTEQRVAQLVASGRSNAEVASSLFMSPKTVAANLSRIYAKLQVRSRTELAALLHASEGSAVAENTAPV